VTTQYTVIETPIGRMVASGDSGALSGLSFADSPEDPSWARDDAAFREVERQLDAYFAGELTEFDLQLIPGGTQFQRRVWDALQAIPYGTTTTYGRLAAVLGADKAVRAVGHANGRNPISIIIPCHRVIAADGRLTGYGGGLHRKQWLLSHETAHAVDPAVLLLSEEKNSRAVGGERSGPRTRSPRRGGRI
jgi:methylated-DNA-[protein]-cysteine S-methyltransferase